MSKIHSFLYKINFFFNHESHYPNYSKILNMMDIFITCLPTVTNTYQEAEIKQGRFISAQSSRVQTSYSGSQLARTCEAP